MKKLFTLLTVIFTFATANAQLLLSDDFNYVTNDSLVANGWTSVSGANTNAMRATSSGLSFGNYPSNGIGNSAYVISNGQDAAKPFTTATSGNVYASFIMKTDTVRTGDYFFAMLDNGTATNYLCRTFIKLATNTSYFFPGISKTNETAIYAKDSFLVGSTCLFVVKYAFNTVNTTDDSVSLFVFAGGNIPTIEPTFPLAKPVVTTQADASNLGRVALRQGSAASAPAMSLDGVRIGTNWSDVLIGIKTPPPAPLFATVAGLSQTSVAINWTKPIGYVDSLMTTLAFIKAVNPVNAGTPTKPATVYTANTAFPLGTAYQNDTAAKCVFNADGNGVTVTGLTSNTLYQVLLFAVRNADSAYSVSAAANGSTFGVVAPPSSMKFGVKFNSPYNATVTMSKDTNYRDSTMTILLFMKKGFGLNVGTPVKGTGIYTPNNNFPYGTGYENDTFAKCIYKGDSAKFDINGLSPRTFYTFMSLIVRDKDSAYSISTIYSDSTGSFTPPSLLGMKFGQIGTNNMGFVWTKPLGYVDSTMQTLIFVKANAGIATQGYLSKDASLYIANSNFSSSSTPFQLDTQARCMYNGDSASVMVTGLQPGTNYYAVGYVVRKADSSYYSSVAGTNASTAAFPQSLTTLAFNASGQTTAGISWSKPPVYDTTNNQMIVFVKALNPIGTAKPVKHPASYIPNSNFTLNGTKYENDTLAKCVYHGDGNTVNITGLVQGTTYHVLAFNTRLNDSTWSSGTVTFGATFGAVLPPAPVTGAFSNNTGSSSGVVSWSKDSTYNDSTMTILVFAKAKSPVNGGSPMKPAAAYNADASLKGIGTNFELDTMAKCVYKGDGTKVGLVDLDSQTTYHFAVYVIRDKDSLWSSSKITSFTTQAPVPPTVLATKIDGVSLSSARISWTKPAGYNNANVSTLVFLKESGSVNNPGSPTKSPIAFVPSTIFRAGSMYQYDSNAYTVYKGDTNFVVVTNMRRGINYSAFIMIVRDADSVYGPGVNVFGSSLPLPSLSPIGLIAKVNTVTGVPDSMNVKVRVRGVAYGYNQRPTGLQFVARDGSGGITLFRSTGNFGYATYAEGDSVEAEGSITTFRGLVELNLDTIIVLGNNRPLQPAKKVGIVEESGENDLLRIDSVRFMTPPAGGIWAAASTNYSVITPKGDTVVLRVLSNCTLAGTNLPTTPTFSVVGLGVQFSTSSAAPFLFNGYQLFPRGSADIIPVIPPAPLDTLSRFNLVSPAPNSNITIVQDTSVKVNFNWRAAKSTVIGINPMYMVLLDTMGGNFSSPRFSIPSGNSGLDTSISGPVALIAAALNIAPGQTYKGVWTVVAQGGSFIRKADSIFAINFIHPPAPVDTLGLFVQLLPANNASIAIQGDTGTNVTFTWTSVKSNVVGITPKYMLGVDTIGNNMSNLKIWLPSRNNGLDTTLSLSYAAISGFLGLTPGDNYKANWGVEATGGSFKRRSSNLGTVTFTRGLFNAVKGIDEIYVVSLYPNPAADKLNISTGNHAVESAKLIDMAGRVTVLPISGKDGQYEANVDFCMPGIYMLQLKYGNFVTTHKIQISK